MNEEMWKPVVGFESDYEVSSHGRVRASRDGNHGQYKAGRLIAQTPHKNHYVLVTLNTSGGKTTCKSVHSMVLEAFRGPRPPKNVSRHLDGCRTNNAIENLQWGTSSENAAGAKKHGTFVEGEKNGFAKLCNHSVNQIRSLRDCGYTYKQIGSLFRVHWSTVALVVQGKTWRHVA